jgi:hypothetical protein
VGLFLFAGLPERASNEVKSRSTRTLKPVSVNFDIVLNPYDYGEPDQRLRRGNFSHRIKGKVKNILENLCGA